MANLIYGKARSVKKVTKVRLDLFNPLSGKRSQATGKDNPALEMIWHAVSTIPRGKVSTYGAVARAVGLPGRARQVGYALRVAPEELHLPWHRVLGAGGRIVFPAGSREYKEQATRLRAEGVKVRSGRVPPASVASLEDI